MSTKTLLGISLISCLMLLVILLSCLMMIRKKRLKDVQRRKLERIAKISKDKVYFRMFCSFVKKMSFVSGKTLELSGFKIEGRW